MKEKLCSKCKKTKVLEEFGLDRGKLDGHKYSCKKCHNEYNNKLRTANPESYLSVNLAYARSERGKELQRINGLRRKFWPNLTSEQAAEQYNILLDKQNHCCGCCGKHKSEFKIALAVDHSHITNKIRGLLCNKCNRFVVGKHTLQSARKMLLYFEMYEESK